MTVKSKVLDDIDELARSIAKDRQWLHMHPEIGFKEYKTAEFVQRRLKSLGIPFVAGIAETGIVATIRGARDTSGRVVGLRADMDALMMDEHNEFEHRSRHPNCMHGCGHDGHTAIMLGVAELLSQNPDFDGTVQLIFQPCEEGGRGAKSMMEAGLFERFPVDEVYGLHNWPDLPANEIGVLEGPLLSSGSYMKVTLKGKGCHGALPHQGTPLTSVLAHVILAINTYLAQQLDTQEVATVTLPKIVASEAFAVLPEQITMEGSVRLLDAKARDQLFAEMPVMIENLARAFGATAEVTMTEVVPVCWNDRASYGTVCQAAENLSLPLHTKETGLRPIMGSEDFGCFTLDRPGAYFLLGQGDKDTHSAAIHTPTYDFNDGVIATGIAMFKEIVSLRLGGQ